MVDSLTRIVKRRGQTIDFLMRVVKKTPRTI